MNLTRVLNNALPDIPARILSDRCPRVPPDIVFKEHVEDGQPIVRVLVSSQDIIYRFPPQNWALAQLFDGQRSFAEIAQLYSGQVNAAYDVEEVREFAASLEAAGFWYKTPQEKNIALMQQSAEDRRKLLKSRKSKFGDLSQILFPAVNPDGFLTSAYKYTSFIYTGWFTLLTLVVFGLMAGITIAHWPEISRDTLRFFNFSEKTWTDVGVFYLVAVGAMCWHELGHGHACKHYGGRVPSMGFLLIYLTPAFYTDLGEAQVRATRYQRLIISLAGAWSELYICAVATFIWWGTTPDTATHEVAYMMMLITGIASVLINFNPLMKLDGYFIMCEFLGIADLKEISTAYVSAWVKHNVWGLPVEVPYVPRRRRLGFVVYATLSGLYSYTVLYVIARFVGNVFRNFNPDWSFIPEIATAVLIFRSRIRTLVNFMRFVYLDKKDRVRAWFGTTRALVAAGVFALLLFLPLWHESTSGRFVLEPASIAVIRNPAAGILAAVYTEEGSRVATGAPIAQLDNLLLESQLDRGQTDYEVASMRANSASLHYSNLGTALRKRAEMAQQSQEFKRQVASLELRSPISGVVLTPRLADRLGTRLPEGTELAEVGDLGRMRARIYVSEHDLYKIRVGQSARLEVEGFFNKRASNVASVAAIATEMDGKLSEARKFMGLLRPNFYLVDLEIANPDSRLKPGMIGFARIYGDRRSAAGFAWRSVSRFINRKVW
jgi:putative peptide zinc metalloprotease protein